MSEETRFILVDGPPTLESNLEQVIKASEGYFDELNSKNSVHDSIIAASRFAEGINDLRRLDREESK